LPASFFNRGTDIEILKGRRQKMTKKNMKKLLDEPQYDLKRIFYDEARKVETDDRVARRLAEEAFHNLRLQLEHSHV
jgi:hypothetical protein